MKKGLMRKIGAGILIAGNLGLSSCNQKYVIDGYETVYNSTLNDIKITKEKEKIFYDGAMKRGKDNLNNDSLLYVQINFDSYFPDDTLVYPTGAEMFKYLKQEIRKQKQEQGLNALGRDVEGWKK